MIGAGVSGLTTAVVLRRAGVDAHVVTDRPPDQLVSWVAGAIWTIPGLGGESPMAPWAIRTREEFERLAGVPDAGVSTLYLRELFRDDPGEVWWEATPWVERLDPPAGYSTHLGIHGFVVDPPVYLAWLHHELESLGGFVTRRHVRTLDDIDGDIVNASGLGAVELVGDSSMYPIRGQVVAVSAPEVEHGVADESDPDRVSYVYPRPNEVVVGGVRQVGADDLAVDPIENERMLDDARLLEPRLDGAVVLDVRVGLRPGRARPRVELEVHQGRRVVHNYGHAGKGYLLSWGCAEQVLGLLTT